MKKLLLTPILALLIMAGSVLKAQDRADDYLGLPGDNLNLYAVMNLFQESKTLEEFERKLNEEDSRINNLDLNNDGYVDYINVTDHVDGNVHTIVMQDVLGPNENQDVAVFTVERFRDGSVQIQLVGDEALYGRNYVIEPISEETPNPGYGGNVNNRRNGGNTYITVSAWPLISYIYDPYYVGWHSSWYWGYYPSYWHPWSPCFYHFYYGYHYNYFPLYYSHYHHYDHIRLAHYNDYYYNRMRVYSPTVVVNINKGNYRKTYSRPESRRDGEALYSRTHSERSSNISRRDVNNGMNNGNSRRFDSGSNVSRSNNSRRDAVSTSRPARDVSTTRSSRESRISTRSSRTDNAPRSSRESVSSSRPSRESSSVRSSRSSGNSGNARSSRESGSSRPSREMSTTSRSRENMTMSRSYGSESRSYSAPSYSRSQASRSTTPIQRSAPSYDSRISRSSAPSRSYEARSSSAPSRNYEARSSSAPSRSYEARSSAPSRSYSSGSVSRSSAPRQSSASVGSSGSRSSSGSSRTAGSSHSSSDNGRSRR